MDWFSPRPLLFRLIPAVLSLLLATGVQAQKNVLYYSNPPHGFATSKISKQLLKEDMQYWQQVMEESHVNPYHTISKKRWQGCRQLSWPNCPTALPISRHALPSVAW
ncbi:MAG: hypothetical protein IPJ02_00735 [Chitinophagaceae bacterium]|nr:hypothetical protein [Chitinophagaceae bacterium]